MKYTIIKVDDRAEKYVAKNAAILKEFERVDDIIFVDGRLTDAELLLKERGIDVSTWNPYDGRIFAPMAPEFGVWATTINLLQYIVDNCISELLVLEDDVELLSDFVHSFGLCFAELPSNYDYFALFSLPGQNEVTESSETGKRYIHKSINQPASACGMLYSLKGARRILKLMHFFGMQYTSDCFIHRMSHEGYLHGYSIKTQEIELLRLPDDRIVSTIDPLGRRQSRTGEPAS